MFVKHLVISAENIHQADKYHFQGARIATISSIRVVSVSGKTVLVSGWCVWVCMEASMHDIKLLVSGKP